MTEYEKAEQDVAAAKVAERVAEWRAMDAKAAYYRYAGEAMAASAEVMGARIRRDNALASEFVEKAQAAALSVPEVAEVEIPEGFVKWEGGECPVVGSAVGFEVVQRCGTVCQYRNNEATRSQAHWVHLNDPYDIIAYRVLPIEPAAAPDPWSLGHTAGFSAHDRDPSKSDIWQDGYNTGERDRANNIKLGEPVPNDDGTRPEAPDTITIAASEQHAEESARAQSLPPLFKPEPPQAATPEQLMESGAINGEAYGLWRKLATGRKPEEVC